MSGFELDNRGADEIDTRASESGVPLMPGAPSFFGGAPSAAIKGLARGTVAKGALLLGDALTPTLKPSAKALDKKLGTSLDAWLDEQQRRNRQAMDELKPDPHTTGFAAQVLGSFLDIGSSAALFTPEGAAILEGYSRKQELEAQGVSPDVAAAGGTVSGLATLVGVKAPVTLGRTAVGQGPVAVAKNMGYGAAANVSAGVAERGTMRELLERTGFKDQAKLFEPYDEQAMLAEIALGALFSGTAAAIELRSTPRGQRAVDAALTAKAAHHQAIDTAPGIPADARAAAAHAQAIDIAMEQALRNEPVNVGDVLAEASFLPRDQQNTEIYSAELKHAEGERSVNRVEPVSPRSPEQAMPMSGLVLGQQLRAEIADARIRLAHLESPDAQRLRAAELQQSERLSFKQAMSQAKREFGAQADEARARVSRLESMIDSPQSHVDRLMSDGTSSAASLQPNGGSELARVVSQPNELDLHMRAAAEAVQRRPDMFVAQEDGTTVRASDLLARVESDRMQAEQDSRAFQAAVHCFLRS